MIITDNDDFDYDLRKRLVKCVAIVGEHTWKEGLLLKGNGLCHGLAGNAYMLNHISRFYSYLER
jgi:hypothetical protein